MTLSSLINEYRACEAALYDAIGTEQAATIREVDIRMNWLRNIIRDFDARSRTERLKQVEFFITPLAQAADLQFDNPLFRDLRAVVERYASRVADNDDTDLDRQRAQGADADSTIDLPALSQAMISAIEQTDLRLSVVDRGMRYVYASPATERYYGMPASEIVGRHMSELIGTERFERRARNYLEKCFAGEDQCYYYYLDTERHGHQLLECRLLHQRATGNREAVAVIIMRDLTNAIPDPVRVAEENRI